MQNGNITIENKKYLKIKKAFWLNEFKDDVELLDLPTDFKRPQIRSYLSSVKSFYIDAQKTSKLRKITKDEDVTMFMVVFSILAILLGKLGSKKDVTIGTGVTNRNNIGLDNIIGIFVNAIALRNYPKGHLKYRDFLTSVKKTVLAAFCESRISV